MMPRYDKNRKIGSILLILLAVQGGVGFMCFLFEECMQTNMFAAFAYQSAKDWDGLKMHVELMESTHKTAEIFIKSIGWLSPLTYPAYLEYLQVNEGYIKSMKYRIRNERR